MNGTIATLPATRQRAPFQFSPEIIEAFGSVQDNYQYHIRRFLDFAREAEGEDMMGVIADYYREVNESTLSASTIRCRRQAVKNRLRRVLAHEPERVREMFDSELRLLDRDPATKCPGAASKAVSGNKVITEAEYIRLMEGARSDRQRRFIQFLWVTGARVSEMTGIRLSDIHVNGTVATIRLRGKGNARQKFKERDVFVSTRILESIKATFEGSTYLFETSAGKRYSRSYVSNQIGRLTLHILGRRVAAHGMRHSFATRLIKTTGRVSAVSTYLGHSDISITLRLYTHDSLLPVDVLGPEAIGA